MAITYQSTPIQPGYQTYRDPTEILLQQNQKRSQQYEQLVNSMIQYDSVVGKSLEGLSINVNNHLYNSLNKANEILKSTVKQDLFQPGVTKNLEKAYNDILTNQEYKINANELASYKENIEYMDKLKNSKDVKQNLKLEHYSQVQYNHRVKEFRNLKYGELSNSSAVGNYVDYYDPNEYYMSVSDKIKTDITQSIELGPTLNRYFNQLSGERIVGETLLTGDAIATTSKTVLDESVPFSVVLSKLPDVPQHIKNSMIAHAEGKIIAHGQDAIIQEMTQTITHFDNITKEAIKKQESDIAINTKMLKDLGINPDDVNNPYTKGLQLLRQNLNNNKALTAKYTDALKTLETGDFSTPQGRLNLAASYATNVTENRAKSSIANMLAHTNIKETATVSVVNGKSVSTKISEKQENENLLPQENSIITQHFSKEAKELMQGLKDANGDAEKAYIVLKRFADYKESLKDKVGEYEKLEKNLIIEMIKVFKTTGGDIYQSLLEQANAKIKQKFKDKYQIEDDNEILRRKEQYDQFSIESWRELMEEKIDDFRINIDEFLNNKGIVPAESNAQYIVADVNDPKNRIYTILAEYDDAKNKLDFHKINYNAFNNNVIKPILNQEILNFWGHANLFGKDLEVLDDDILYENANGNLVSTQNIQSDGSVRRSAASVYYDKGTELYKAPVEVWFNLFEMAYKKKHLDEHGFEIEIKEDDFIKELATEAADKITFQTKEEFLNFRTNGLSEDKLSLLGQSIKELNRNGIEYLDEEKTKANIEEFLLKNEYKKNTNGSYTRTYYKREYDHNTLNYENKRKTETVTKEDLQNEINRRYSSIKSQSAYTTKDFGKDLISYTQKQLAKNMYSFTTILGEKIKLDTTPGVAVVSPKGTAGTDEGNQGFNNVARRYVGLAIENTNTVSKIVRDGAKSNEEKVENFQLWGGHNADSFTDMEWYPATKTMRFKYLDVSAKKENEAKMVDYIVQLSDEANSQLFTQYKNTYKIDPSVTLDRWIDRNSNTIEETAILNLLTLDNTTGEYQYQHAVSKGFYEVNGEIKYGSYELKFNAPEAYSENISYDVIFRPSDNRTSEIILSSNIASYKHSYIDIMDYISTLATKTKNLIRSK